MLVGIGLAAAVFGSACGAGSGNDVPFASGDTQRLPTSSGWEAEAVALSSDGGHVVYVGSQPDRPYAGLFMWDRAENETIVIAELEDGEFGPSPTVSDDGKMVAFSSDEGGDWIPGDAAEASLRDVFIWERSTGNITPISVTPAGLPGNDYSGDPVISADGSTVVFDTSASNLVPEDSDEARDVIAYDVATGTLRLVSVDQEGGCDRPSVSADGSKVAFHSLKAGINEEIADVTDQIDSVEEAPYVSDQLDEVLADKDNVIVRDMDSGSNTVIPGGDWPQISADGQHVAYSTFLPIASEDPEDFTDVYLWDAATEDSVFVSAPTDRGSPAWSADSPGLTSDGSVVVFRSNRSLVNEAIDDETGVFRWERDTGRLTELSDARGRDRPLISDDGRVMVYESNESTQFQVWTATPAGD